MQRLTPRAKRWLVIGVPIVVVVVTLAIVLPLTLSGPERITLHGTISAPGDGAPEGCTSDEGYDDITQGAAVTITAPDGSTLNTGGLEEGTGDDAHCFFEFHVPDIPLGYDKYGVTVSHRGTLMFSEEQVTDGTVSLELG